MGDEGGWGRFKNWFWQRRHRRRRAREAGRQWFLACGPKPADWRQPPPWNRLNRLYPPDDWFWADPFLWSAEGRHYLFFEAYPYALGRGQICRIEVNDRGEPLSEAKTVLAPPYHLSYPFLFEVDGILYMVPEQKTTRRVDVYRATAFPDRFERVTTWFQGVRMVDVTVFFDEDSGLWWLFASEKRNGLRYDESLFAYTSPHPFEAQWTPHPMNPLVVNRQGARCGGRIFRDSGGWLRPSQDCLAHYGAGLCLNRVDLLSPSGYQESLLWRLSGADLGAYRGVHHLDVHGDLMVMDVERYWPSAG